MRAELWRRHLGLLVMIQGTAMHEPFVHEMEDGRIHILILPDDGKWELNVVDLRTPFDRAPQLAGFAQPEDALARGHDYVREVDPEHDCEAKGCHFGLAGSAPE